jgi:tRNA-(ms[2]io[6]A)-hydroxylase
LELGRQRKDDYVNKLLEFQKKGGSRDSLLLEKLLICALIEARSCERFRLLSLYINEVKLREFYHKFMVSEAGHYVLFIDLAKKYFGQDVVEKRWQEYLKREAEIMEEISLRGDRMH